MTMLDEMSVTSGQVETAGSVAYVPQEPWVISATFRENILLGETGHVETAEGLQRYQEILDACALTEVRS